MSFKAFVWAWDQDVPNGDYQHVLLALANIAPAREVRASVAYIAGEVRRSPRKVRAAIDWLAQAEIISVTPRPGKVDLIRLNIPSGFMVYMPDDEDDDREIGARGRPPKTPAPPAKPLQNPCTPCADEPIEPSEPRGLVVVAPDPFEEWWAIYPRKVAKVMARKAWAQMTKQISLLTLEELMIRTRAFATAVINKDPEHIAHAATWLRGERWNDEIHTRSQTDGQFARYPTDADRAAERTATRLDPMLQGAQQALARPRRWKIGG